MSRRKPKLTELEWRKVFQLRCRAKRGEHLPPEDMKLLERAHRDDPERYASLRDAVFEATKPFGAKP